MIDKTITLKIGDFELRVPAEKEGYTFIARIMAFLIDKQLLAFKEIIAKEETNP